MPGSYKTKTLQSQITDMCTAKHKNQQLLIAICGMTHGVRAYSATSDKLVWQVKGKLTGMEKEMKATGITTNGHSCVFVADSSNSCIQTFKTDGSYIGALLKFQDNSQSEQWRIRWCDSVSSLIIARKKESHCHIGVFKVSAADSLPAGEENSSADLNTVETVPEYKWEGIYQFSALYIVFI